MNNFENLTKNMSEEALIKAEIKTQEILKESENCGECLNCKKCLEEMKFNMELEDALNDYEIEPIESYTIKVKIIEIKEG